jgi:hypothetical protein
VAHLPHPCAQDITSASRDAVAFFLQGLGLRYAYNQAEALLNFQRAVELDPQCCMCHWGVAYSVGPNINKYNMADDEWAIARQGISSMLVHY